MKLEEIAKKMCAKGKGILAADESTGTIAKRFKSINVENTEKNRLVFRQTLFSSEAMKNYIGGVILFDETIKQKTTLGPTVPELISKNNAIPGIKVDKGAKPLAGSQDYRPAVPFFHAVVVPGRRAAGTRHSLATRLALARDARDRADAVFRWCQRVEHGGTDFSRVLHHAVHHARHGDDFPGDHSHSGRCLWKLPDSVDDWRR